MTVQGIRDLSVEEMREDGGNEETLYYLETLILKSQSETNIKPRQTDASSVGIGKGLFYNITM